MGMSHGTPHTIRLVNIWLRPVPVAEMARWQLLRAGGCRFVDDHPNSPNADGLVTEQLQKARTALYNLSTASQANNFM